MQTLAGQDPAGMGPPGALARRMRIAFVIGMLVMDAMRGYPENGPPFERERATPRQDVLDPFVRLISTVGKQPVITHTDAQHASDDVKNQRREDGASIDEEKCGESADVKARHRSRRHRVHAGLILPPVSERRRSHARRRYQ